MAREPVTIYIDEDFCCHTTNIDGKYREIETDFFYDKCDTFIEGFMIIPDGEKWIRDDGEVFYGDMISPWKNDNELQSAQLLFERDKEIAELDAMILEMQFQNLMEDL